MSPRYGMFESWKEVWVMFLNLVGICGLLLLILFAPLLWRWLR